MSNRDKTFWAVVIPVVVYFRIQHTADDKGCDLQLTNYKGYGSYDYVGLRNYTDLFTDARVWKELSVYL